MIRLASLTLILLNPSFGWGQIPDFYYVGAAEAANRLVGQNVSVSNATFIGSSDQLARFNDGTNKIGFAEGIALTTSRSTYAGVDGQQNEAPSYGAVPENIRPPANPVNFEPDLDVLNGSGTVKAAAVLEFDFVTTNNSVSFTFVFASEEYPEEVCTQYNDVFGFFLSGPGISGPFSDNAINIAKVPGSNAPIAINTVNIGQAGGFGNPSNCFAADPNWQANSIYYVNNVFNHPLGNPINEGNAQWVYDGHTVVMSVSYPVQCNTAYHAKIAICNTADTNKDSGVFIKSGTLTSPFAAPGPISITPQPVCEGEPLTLFVEGDAAWNYSWSAGQSGVGLQQITTTASTAIDSYSVTVEYLPGCTLTSSEAHGRAVVHIANNAPPTCPGGNLFVQAESTLSFTVPTSDAANEEVTIAQTAGPGTFSVNTNPIHDIGAIQWTPSENDIGYHIISFQVQDNNVCGPLTSTCQYNVKVMCRYCPTCVYYENRTPSGLPLPEYTVAGACIVAGSDIDASQANGPVIVGDASVTFEAPSISLEPGFTSGPGFTALVNYDACVEDCEGCCEVMAGGISYNLVPNVFTPNGDGVNDYWQVLDELHPYCAYNANFFDLWIYSSWGGDVVAHRSGQGYCCPFVSRAPGVNVLSSINWDGRANGSPLACNGCFVSNGVYYYVLEIESSCGPVETLTGYIHVLGSPAGGGGGNLAIQQDGPYEVLVGARLSNEVGITDDLIGVDKEVVFEAVPDVTDALLVYPNPTRDQVIIRTSQSLELLKVHDGLGRTLLSNQPLSKEVVLSLGALAPGSYYLSVLTTEGVSHVERIIKH